MLRTSRWYWVVAVAMIATGFVAILSFGAPLVLLGLGLVLAGPWRDRPGVVRAVVAGVVGLVVGYLLVAPLTCTASASASVTVLTTDGGAFSGATRCTNVLGIPYRGGPDYDPPLAPALGAGLAAGALAATLAYRSASRARRPEDAVAPVDPTVS